MSTETLFHTAGLPKHYMVWATSANFFWM